MIFTRDLKVGHIYKSGRKPYRRLRVTAIEHVHSDLMCVTYAFINGRTAKTAETHGSTTWNMTPDDTTIEEDAL